MDSRVPKGRLARLAGLATMGAKAGASMLLSQDGAVATAKDMTAALGRLRGLAAKAGQMASYVDGIVPEAHRETFEASLKALRAAAPTSSIVEIRALVEEELGNSIDRLFAEWNDVPIASASIGQVHRARFDGKDVAVKVQHPGIATALENDLKNIGALEAMTAIGGARRYQTKPMLDAIRARFREELDYAHEASQQTWFRRLHANDSRIRIPAIIERRSSRRVLCSEFVSGMSFEEACAHEEIDREKWAKTLWRFVFKGNLIGGRFNADPHPGNYVFHPDGVITFLDFGCVQVIPQSNQPHARMIHQAAIDRDEAKFRQGVRGLLNSRPGPHEDLLTDFTRACFTPLFEQPFRFDKVYAASLVDHMRDLGIASIKLPKKELLELSSDIFFMNRLEFGLYSILARLDVSVDYAEIERTFMAESAES